MTTPGGVPNLPQGALTLETLGSKLQDMSGTAMKSRAVERFPSIMDNSTGLSPALDITPFGILTRIWAEVNSLVANADPADIQGPEDLPELVLEFIEGLPVIGQFVDLFEAILGNYDGDDEILLGIQTIFAPIRALVQLIPGLFAGFSIDDLASLNPATVWSMVVSTLIKPLNLLAPLNGFGFLPDANRPQLLQDTIDSVVDVFQTGTQGTSSGNNLATAFLSLLGIHRTGTGAQSQNVVQDSQIGSLLSGGSGLFDTFDGASATSLPTARWEQTYSGSGSGTSGLSGAGVCIWRPAGASARGVLNRYKTALGTDTQLVSLTLSSNLPLSTIANDPAIRLQGRMNSTHDTYVEARINYGQAEIGIVVSGTYTRLGAQQSLSGDSSGTWSLKLGTVSSSREFVLLRNNVTVMTRSDSGATSGLGASYRFPGFGQVAGVQWLGGILFFQQAPPDVESFGASDRLAAL